MIKLSSNFENHLVLNCRFGHVDQISVEDLIEVYDGDLDVEAVQRTARCLKCKGKSISSLQIIYVGGNFHATNSANTLRESND